uniref:Fibrinogen C-terminal domain-containing protein n=1 Tax=Anopheles farauti TaxID=69004 RepID=A0A182QJC4_9DIPT
MAIKISESNEDLTGLYFELLLTHLVAIESRIQTTLQEIAQNQTIQFEQLKLRPSLCHCSSPAASAKDEPPTSSGKSYHLETIAGFGSDRTLDGAWILFQHRYSGTVDFSRSWHEYRTGFGTLEQEHWLGLDRLHGILQTGRHELLVVMESFDGEIRYAHYDAFSIGSEQEKYAIQTVGKYTGTAGDAMRYHVGSNFTTYDQDNDTFASNCATLHGGGWWFKDCYSWFV